MNNLFKTLNNIQTHLITYGDPFDCGGSDVIICVTGNPGITDFYIEFAAHLHDITGLPVCVIGQAGHEEVPDENSNKLETQEHLFDLQGQIKHKLDLIDIVDKKSKLHLIGHSIGAWMALEILNPKNQLIQRTKSVNLLFPTIQRMAESSNGVFLNKIVRRIHAILLILVNLICLLPESVKLFLIRLYLKVFSLPRHYTERIRKYANPKVVQKVLYLAYDEMDSVRDLNVSSINGVKDRTQVLYSANDGWAPVSYMDDLKQFHPDILLKEVRYDHAFVLRSAEPVAEMVAAFIKNKQ